MAKLKQEGMFQSNEEGESDDNMEILKKSKYINVHVWTKYPACFRPLEKQTKNC